MQAGPILLALALFVCFVGLMPGVADGAPRMTRMIRQGTVQPSGPSEMSISHVEVAARAKVDSTTISDADADADTDTDMAEAAEAKALVNLEADVKAITALSNTKVALWNSVAGQVIRAENRNVWDEVTTKLKNIAEKGVRETLSEWFREKKCDLCQRVMRNLVIKGCTWGVQKICEWSAGAACVATGVPFASTICSKACAFGFEVILAKECEEWVSTMIKKFPGNTLNFCQAKQFCGALDKPIPCECCDAGYCKASKLC